MNAAGVWAVAVLAAAVLRVGSDFVRTDAAAEFGLLRDLVPLGPHLAANAARSAAAAGLAAMLLVLNDAAGLRLLRWVAGRSVSPGSAARFAAPLAGMLAASAALFGAGETGMWFPGVLLAALAGLAWFARPAIPAAIRDWRDAGAAVWATAGPWERIGGAAALAILGSRLFLPETDFDCMSYSLTFPQQALLRHHLPVDYLFTHWLVPLPAELPHVWPLMAGLDPAARLAGTGLAMAGSLALLRAFGGAGLPAAAFAWWAALALVLPEGRWVFATAKNDSVACGCALAGTALILEGGIGRRRLARAGILLAGALLLGGAVAAKYLLAPLAAAIAAAALWRAGAERRFVAALLLAAGLLLPFSPWGMRSWLLQGDPVYPLGGVVAPRIVGEARPNGLVRAAFVGYARRFRNPERIVPETAGMTWRGAALCLAAAPVLGRAAPPGGLAILAGGGLALAVMSGGMRENLGWTERYLSPVFALANLLAVPALAAAQPPVRACAALLGLACTARIAATGHPRDAGAFLAGRTTAAGFRLAALGSYGALWPGMNARLAGGRGELPAVLATGELVFWDIRARVLTQYVEPNPMWRAAAGCASAGRFVIRMRQTGARWILHNSVLAGMARFGDYTYEWTPEMLRMYTEYARRRFEVVAASGRADPDYGCGWLIAVASRPFPPRPRVLFIPGAETGFVFAGHAEAHGVWADAAERYAAMRGLLPELVALDGLLGHVLVMAGREREAYPLLRASAEAGLLDEYNLADLAVAAAKLGRREEAVAALRRAAVAYPLAPGRIREAERAVAASARISYP